MLTGEPTGPTGPEKFPRTISLYLQDRHSIEELAGATGSASPAELVDIALSALEWVVKNRREGNRIIAMREIPEGTQANELLVDLKDQYGE